MDWKYMKNKQKIISKLVEVFDLNDEPIYAMEDSGKTTMRQIILVDKLNEIIDQLNNLKKQ